MKGQDFIELNFTNATFYPITFRIQKYKPHILMVW